MIDRNLYLAYVYLYGKLSSNLKLIKAPVLSQDGQLSDFSVNLYADSIDDADECEINFGLSEAGFSLITRLEDISVNTWSKRIDAHTFEDENHYKIYEMVLEQIVSAVNKGWVKLDKCHPKLLNDLIEHDLVFVKTVQTFNLTEYSKLK